MMKRRPSLRSLYFALAFALVLALLPLWFQGASARAAVKTVIVELAGEPVAVAKYRAEQAGEQFDTETYRRQVIAEQESFLQRAAAAGVSYKVAGVSAPNGDVTADVTFRFNYVYNGVALEVAEAAVPVLEGLEGVRDVHDTPEMTVHLDRAIDYTRASGLYGNPPRLTQFDEAATGGLHGEGIIVAVIDTGVDWAHPMFGGDPTPPQFGFSPAIAAGGPNKKVIYYMNLTAGVAGDDFGHGTHVAGDIAGYIAAAPGDDKIPMTADDIQIHGVAPKARVMAYKTLSGAGTGSPLSTIMAIEDAVQPLTVNGYPKPVPHVINLSLGSSDGGNPNSPASIACDNATLAGVTVVASAGNSGLGTPEQQAAQNGAVGSPGSGRRVLTVGANNDPGKLPKDPVTDLVFDSGAPSDLSDVLNPAGLSPNTVGLVDGTGKAAAAGQRTNINVIAASGSPAIGSPVAQYYAFAGTVAVQSTDVPASVAGRIAIARPSGAYGGVAAQLAAKGAAAAMLITPDTTGKITVVNSTIPVWSIKETDARYLLDLLSSADATGVDPARGALSEYPIRVKLGMYTPAMAAFSSRGPILGYGQVKPDVTAPGVQILSATVRAGGIGVSTAPGVSYMIDPTGYKSANGTSFSAPIAAGVAALIKQKHPQWTPAMIRAALINTATNLRRGDGTPLADGKNSILEQGGGLIDAVAAADAKALMGAGTPGPVTGRAPAVRPFAVGVGPLAAGSSPGNPDFSASYSFGAVPVAGVIGSSAHTQTVNIHDISNGEGAGTYQLAASDVRFVDGASFRVDITDANGNAVSEVTVPANGSASFNVSLVVNGEAVTNPTQVQWYVTAMRADGGQRLRMPFYFRATAPTVSTAAPALGDINGTEVADNPNVDINGAYRLQFSKAATGDAPAKFRVQESADGGATWATLADVDGSQTAFDVTDRGNGTYQYRVVGLHAVQHGLYAGPASAAKAVRVDRRIEADVSSMIQAAIVDGTLSFAGGVAQFDQTLKNTSGTTIYPPLRFVITSIQSASGRVTVMNADNGGSGTKGSPASFDYSGTFGFDLAPSETSAAKRLKFSNPASELFQFTAVVRAHLPDPAFPGSSAGGGSTPTGGDGGGGADTQTGSATDEALGAVPTTLTFTVNPLTHTIQLVQ
jgi:subtilisin family serine protease